MRTNRERWIRRAGLAAGAALAVVGLVVVVPHGGGGPRRPAAVANGAVGTQPAAAPTDAPPEVSWQRPAVSADELAERSGVRLVRVSTSGGGGLLDVRYQVVDAEKAAGLHDPATPPGLVDERTGLVFDQPLMGHTHSGDLHTGQTYFVVLENTGDWVRPGSQVTVLLGDAQVEHVTVQ